MYKIEKPVTYRKQKKNQKLKGLDHHKKKKKLNFLIFCLCFGHYWDIMIQSGYLLYGPFFLLLYLLTD